MKPVLMSHNDRQRLIYQPFQTQRIPGKSWAGVLISDPVIYRERRLSYSEDENYIRYGKDDEGML